MSLNARMWKALVRVLSVLLSLLGVAAPALAVDGAREINQTCAESTGCFAGDTAGFPVTITAPGSYRLTSNLLVASASTDAIVVASARVSIDLNGFGIAGVTSCTAVLPIVCTPLGSGRAVAVSGPGVAELRVSNGSVAGMGNAGVYVGASGRVEDVRSSSNGGPGIRTEDQAVVSRCSATHNGGPGIQAGAGSIVADNVVSFTGAGMAGIQGDNLIVRGNFVRVTGGDGILADNTSLVTDNQVASCNGDGIEVGLAAKVDRNVVVAIVGYALHFLYPGSYADNMIDPFGGAGTISGPGIDKDGNVCESGACP